MEHLTGLSQVTLSVADLSLQMDPLQTLTQTPKKYRMIKVLPMSGSIGRFGLIANWSSLLHIWYTVTLIFV